MDPFKIKINKQELSAVITVNNQDKALEISGDLEAIDTGRDKEYTFNPSWFSNKDAEQFYNLNWETIDKKIKTLI